MATVKAKSRWPLVAAGLGSALVVLAVVSVLGIGGGSHTTTAPRSVVAAAADNPVPLARYFEQAPHVTSRLVITALQGEVSGAPLVPPPEAPPVAASAVAGPVAQYIAYSQAQLKLMAAPIKALETALAANDRSAAKAAWNDAFSRYLHLGAVYLEGPIADLNDRIDGPPGGLSGGTASQQFTGLHRIEYGLWTGAAPSSLLGYASQLSSDVNALRAQLAHVSIDPLDYATRAHEILEDAQRDLLSGTDVPWSQQGVLGTASGLAATQEVVATLRPLLRTYTQVIDSDLGDLSTVLNSLARAHGGTLPTNTELSQTQTEELDAAVGQALEGLSQVPGELETVPPPTIQQIPAKDLEIDK
jgi:iron uptake system EfeUOB component EfeO/EfeM